MWSLSRLTGRIFKNGIVPEGADRRALPRLLKGSLRVHDRLALSGWLPGRTMVVATGICLLLVTGGAVFSNTDSGDAFVASLTSKLGFRVREIRISGTHEIHREHVREELKVDDSTSVVTYSVQKARERLYELAWVDKVTVTKIYPDTLTVEIVERKPFAVWQHEGKLSLVERNGDVIVPFEAKFEYLPVVVGQGANEKAAELVELVSAYPVVFDNAKAFVLVSGRRWNVELKNGVKVMLPEKNADKALDQFAELEAKKKISEREINVVDLRMEGQMVLRLSEDGLRHQDADKAQKSLVGGNI